ncbi:MAG: hypothetical protein Q8P48_08000, partial [Deltaproteobacteria bacterium]|nr:hypothetical protein [Deltaproteobacteria bacterium]
MKRVAFWGILLSPAFLVLFFIAVFFADVIRINRVSHDDIGRSFNRFLAAREGTSFPPPKAFHEMEPGGANVFLFGASSVVISDKLTFADYLEKDLGADNRNIKVVNFGIPGIDSHSVKSRVEQSLRFSPAPPRAIILYFGHNDYNVAYTSSLNTHWDDSFNTFLKIGYHLSGRKFNFPDQKFVFKAEEYNEYLWYAIFTRPVFFNIAQRLRLYRVDNAKYGEYNARILEQFKNNTEEILRMARSESIPVIIVTPIGNLHARPYGDIGLVDRNYRLGTRAKDYMESVG